MCGFDGLLRGLLVRRARGNTVRQSCGHLVEQFYGKSIKQSCGNVVEQSSGQRQSIRNRICYLRRGT